MPVPPRPVPSAALHHLPAITAIRSGAHHLTALHLLDELDEDRFLCDVERICAALQAHGPAGLTVAGMRAAAAHALAAELRVKGLTLHAHPRTRHEANRLRNTMLACLSATAHAAGLDPAIALPDVPGVLKRATDDRRAEDDEIVLMRLRAVATAEAGGRSMRRALTYILMEAGARTGETTAVLWKDLDDPRNPASVRLPGGYQFSSRTALIPAWARPTVRLILGRMLAHNEVAPNGPITYSGSERPGGSKASASACTMLRALIEHSGLDTATLEPLAITRWRVNVVREQAGVHAARELYGGASLDRTLDFCRLLPDPTVTPSAPVNFLDYNPYAAVGTAT